MNEEKWIEVINKIQMDDSMKQRLYNNCMKKKSVQQRMKHTFLKPITIGIGAICILISVPTIAHIVSNVVVRMQNMSHQEVESLNQMIQEQEAEADSYSRKLTEDEENRKKVLFEQYINEGKFPEGEIKLVEGEEATLVNELYYDIHSSSYNLPNRALTDEELLQMIDFYHKRDYSLQVMNKVEKPTVDEKQVEDMNLMEKAQYIIDTIYNVDTSQMQRTIACSDEEKKIYEISFTEGTRGFYIRIGGDGLKVYRVAADLENELDTYKVVTKEIAENEKGLVEESKRIIKDVFGEKQPIKNVWCNYFIGDGDRAQDRKIHYLFEMEDGTGYIFWYVQENGTLYEFNYMSSFKGYQTMIEQNDKRDLERGLNIKREQFKID